jgi:hypothetical protein
MNFRRHRVIVATRRAGASQQVTLVCRSATT